MSSDSPPSPHANPDTHPDSLDATVSPRVLPAHEYRRERWRNGLGWTREILRQPDREDWDWRLSIAEIQGDTDFSRFPGVERILVLLHGEGLRLQFDAAEASPAAQTHTETVEIEPPHGRRRFAGERGVHAQPSGDAVHVFNLMWRRDRVIAELWHRPLVGSMVLFVEPGDTWVVFLIGGRASLGDGAGHSVHLAAQDTALATAPGAQRRRYLLDGGGEALLIRVQPAAE